MTRKPKNAVIPIPTEFLSPMQMLPAPRSSRVEIVFGDLVQVFELCMSYNRMYVEIGPAGMRKQGECGRPRIEAHCPENACPKGIIT
jgi:hypothetical protein